MPAAYNGKIYDIIIIGGKTDAQLCISQIVAAKKSVNVLVVAASFSQQIKCTGVDYLTDRVVYSTYNHGLIKLDTKTRLNLFGKNLIIATGTKPKLFNRLPDLPVKYSVDDLSPDKTKSLLIIGATNEAVQTALKQAKKYKTVYLINDDQTDYNSLSVKYPKAVLPLSFTNITGYKQENGKPVEVSLDTYDTIVADDLLAMVGKIPDVNGIATGMINIDAGGYVITDKFGKTTTLPNVYAFGGVSRKIRTSAEQRECINRILN